MRVGWQGTDIDEMAPTPILVGSIEGSRETVDAVLDSLPTPRDVRAADASVYFDNETNTVDAALMSGASMHPSGRWDGDMLYFSTSAAAAEPFLADGRHKTLAAPRPGNVYVRVDPAKAIQELVAVGENLAREGLLRNYSAVEFDEQSADWLDRAATLESAHLLASVNNRQIEAEIYVTCAPQKT
jgi:hypothetical protein